MRTDRAREAALEVLTACRRNGAWVDGALKHTLRRNALTGRDAAFVSRLTYGVVQNRIYLDFCLARCLTQRPEKLEPLLLDILRLGAYQILLMDKVPGDTVDTPIWDRYRQVIDRHEPGKQAGIGMLERFAFYEEAGRSYCIVATGEQSQYANIIIRKGVIR